MICRLWRGWTSPEMPTLMSASSAREVIPAIEARDPRLPSRRPDARRPPFDRRRFASAQALMAGFVRLRDLGGEIEFQADVVR